MLRGEPAKGESGATRVLDLFDADALFPAAEWLGGADKVVCGAGYNATGKRSGWATPREDGVRGAFARPIDDQAWRVGTCAGYPMRANGADTLGANAHRGGDAAALAEAQPAHAARASTSLS